MDNIKWGIIGLGGIAKKFASHLKETEGGVLHAAASRSKEKANQFAKDFDALYAYDSYEALLQNKEIDIIYIATPHSHHYENTLMCLNAGFNVLCEKAFALNVDQVKAMIEKAKEKNLFLMEGMWSRFNPTILAAKTEIENGAIGNLKAVKADFCFHFDYNLESRLINKNLAGGALLDIGIYPIFLSYLFFGKPVRMHVDSEYFPNGVDKNLVMLFDYKDGEEAILNASLQYFSPCDGFLYGDKGCIRLHGRWHEATAYTKFRKSMEDPITVNFDKRALTFGYEIDEVHYCLRNGLKESRKWSWQNSIEIMEIMDDVRKYIHLDYGEIEKL